MNLHEFMRIYEGKITLKANNLSKQLFLMSLWDVLGKIIAL
jgi:hypothetical protein